MLWALWKDVGGIRLCFHPEISKGIICTLGPVHILSLLCKQKLHTMLPFINFYCKILYHILSFWMYLKLFDLKISLIREDNTACQRHKGKQSFWRYFPEECIDFKDILCLKSFKCGSNKMLHHSSLWCQLLLCCETIFSHWWTIIL